MSNITQITDELKKGLDKLVEESKSSMKDVQRVAAAQAWKILQLAIAVSVQIIENIATNLSGPDKKAIALTALSEFYDKVFVVVNVPIIPSVMEPILHKYVKVFLMTLVSAGIDAMVTTFREVGVFKTKTLAVSKTKKQRKKI